MTPAAALALIQGYASANRIRLEPHARDRMRERGARYADVRCALTSATRCVLQPNDRWRVQGGCDEDGEELIVVVVIEGEDVVITVF